MLFSLKLYKRILVIMVILIMGITFVSIFKYMVEIKIYTYHLNLNHDGCKFMVQNQINDRIARL